MEIPIAPVDCPLCGNTRGQRTTAGWERCACLYDYLSTVAQAKQGGAHRIPPPIRKPGEPLLPAEYLGRDPWPVDRDHVAGGDWEEWRRMCYRSLLAAYQRPGPGRSFAMGSVGVFNGTRLVDIYFGHDLEYKTLQELDTFPLLILVLGRHDVLTNPYYPHVVFRARAVREFAGKPTWVYEPAGLPVLPRAAQLDLDVRSSPVYPPALPPLPGGVEGGLVSIAPARNVDLPYLTRTKP